MSYKVKLLLIVVPLIVLPMALITLIFFAKVSDSIGDLQLELMSMKLENLRDQCREAQEVLQRAGYAGVSYYLESAKSEIIGESKEVGIRGGRVFILNSGGEFISHPLGEGPDRGLIERIVGKREGKITSGEGPDREIFLFRYFPEWDWILVAGARERTFLNSAYEAGKVTAYTAGATVAVALLVLYLLIGSISRPVRILEESSRKISTGDFDINIPVKSGDEIGRLSETFNNMAWRVRDLIGNLRREITERKQAEEALRQSEKRYRSLVENTLDGYFICEIPSGKFLFLNQRICDIFGYTMEEGLNLTVWEVVLPEDHDRVRERIRTRLDRQRMSTERNIYTSTRKDKTTFDAEISASLVTYQGRIAAQGILRDVTEQERLQRQLQQSQKMEAIGTLAGGIAHDFNNLLMGIQGRASLMMLDMDPSHPMFEHLKGIEEFVRSAANLTRQLLGFARGGKYEVKPINLNEILRDSSRMFGRTKKEIKIHRKYGKDLWTVEVDRGQIEQVLMNLYVNAWQAMPGGGELFLETRNVVLDGESVKPFDLEPGRYVEVSVTDTGTGMDEATRERIFEPFFTTKGMGMGTGLGLASVYGIVKNHGGLINVFSEKGNGATFTICLPASEKDVEEAEEKDNKILNGTETVLLVDDEAMILEVGRDILLNLGYMVLTAGGGQEAIDLYLEQGTRIDVVLLDMIMPGMGGGETFDKLKAIDPDVRVILSSGYSIDGRAAEILERGCRGFIQKPFGIGELSRKMREILDGV